MKKLIILLTLLLVSFGVFAQSSESSTTYRVFRTEFYIYNQSFEKWELQTRNDDLNFSMVSYKNVVNIQAKTPTLYRIDVSTETKIGGSGYDYNGVRYSALECVDMKKCTLDLVRLNDVSSKSFVLSVIFNNETLGKVNLRYYSFLE